MHTSTPHLLRCCKLLSPPATSQLPLRDIPTDGTRPTRGVPSPSFPSIDGGGGAAAADGVMSGDEVGARRASPSRVVEEVVGVAVGEPAEERSSSCAQTSLRADIHLSARVIVQHGITITELVGVVVGQHRLR